jgi:MFS family permease
VAFAEYNDVVNAFPAAREGSEQTKALLPANLPHINGVFGWTWIQTFAKDAFERLGRAYWWVVGIAVVFSIARFSEAFLVLRAQAVGMPVVLVPMVLVLMNVAYALAAYPAGALSDRANRVTILGVGCGLLVAADLVLAFTKGLSGVAIGVALWGLHMGFTQGLLAALVADTAPPELRGTAYGFFNLFSGLALLIASLLAGAFWDTLGPQSTSSEERCLPRLHSPVLLLRGILRSLSAMRRSLVNRIWRCQRIRVAVERFRYKRFVPPAELRKH